MAEIRHRLSARQPTPLRAALVPHPANSVAGVKSVQAILHFEDDCVRADYAVDGNIDQIVIPEPRSPARRDGLWKQTCFELFIGQDDGYSEFNFSPSSQWAAYRFESYRAGMTPLAMSPPIIKTSAQAAQYSLHAEVSIDGIAALDLRPVKIGISAVFKSIYGETEFWALAHPDGAPDFHDAGCFKLQIP